MQKNSCEILSPAKRYIGCPLLHVFRLLVFHGDADRHLTCRCELDGVARQVGENLAQTAWITAQQRGHIRIGGADQLQALLVRLHGQSGGEVVQKARQIEVQHLQVELLGLDFGEIKNVVNQAEQRFTAGAHDFGIAPLLIV